jgi:hypothetical protein
VNSLLKISFRRAVTIGLSSYGISYAMMPDALFAFSSALAMWPLKVSCSSKIIQAISLG